METPAISTKKSIDDFRKIEIKVKGRATDMLEARDGFICRLAFEEGYLGKKQRSCVYVTTI